MKEIETDRIILKAVDVEDAPFMLELFNTPKWIRYIGDRGVKDIAGATEYIQNRMLPQMEACGFGNYVLVRKEDGAKMGTCGLYKREGLDSVDIGYAMLPDFEGKGYTREAAMKLKQLAITEFQMEKLYGITLPENTASRNVLEKLGLKEVGTIRLPDDTEDSVLYSMELRSSTFPSAGFEFLKELESNNSREWFVANKPTFDATFKKVKAFFKTIHDEMVKKDSIDKFHVHRIYRDVRFSKDKTPYKTYFGLHLGRKKPILRGGYYVSLEPGKSFVGGGFWEPNKEDLNRIRKEIELDDSEFRKLLSAPKFVNTFGELAGEELKTAPRGFDKDHPAIDLLRKKQFLVMRSFTDEEVLRPDFLKEVMATFEAMRPLFDYMSLVLTTDANGEPLF